MTDAKDAHVSVLLTHLNDPRGQRALTSLGASTLAPREVVLADGGSRPEILDAYQRLGATLPFPLRVLNVPGSVAASREQAWRGCRHPIIAFLDADEVANPDWLARLIEPIRRQQADFTAGPTTGLTPSTSWERYHAQLEDWFYSNWVARDVLYAPMGNTAWSRRVFDHLAAQDGHVFDARLARGAEDLDVNIRALKAGFRGAYVPGALLHHDHSRLVGTRKVLGKKYHYAYGEFQVKRRHGDFLRARPAMGAIGPKPRHRVELLEPFVRRWAQWKSRNAP